MNIDEVRETARKLTRFKIANGRVPRVSSLARRIVLVPLVRHICREKPEDKVCLRSGRFVGRTVLNYWRNRLKTLAETDAVDALSTAVKYRLLANCAPAGVLLTEDRKSAKCNHHLCPWCHVRRIEAVATAMGLALSHPSPVAKLLGMEIQLFEHQYYRPPDITAEDLQIQLCQEAAYCRGLTKLNSAQIKASVWATSASPSEDGSRYTISTYMFVVRVAGKPILRMSNEWSTISGSNERSNVAEAIKATMHYSAGNMFGDVPLTCTMLRARAGIRLRESTGFLRADGE